MTCFSDHFGQTTGFVVYEIDDNKTILKADYRANIFTGHTRDLAETGHGHNHHGPILCALADCDVLISQGMGRRIYNDLSQAQKEVIITRETEVESAFHLYKKGKLVDYPELGCQHKH